MNIVDGDIEHLCGIRIVMYLTTLGLNDVSKGPVSGNTFVSTLTTVVDIQGDNLISGLLPVECG